MSILIHNCTKCGHKQSSHDDLSCNYKWCACSKSKAAIDPEPVLVETYVLDGRRLADRIEPLLEPGSVWNADNGSRQPLCNCQRCQDRYAELTR